MWSQPVAGKVPFAVPVAAARGHLRRCRSSVPSRPWRRGMLTASPSSRRLASDPAALATEHTPSRDAGGGKRHAAPSVRALLSVFAFAGALAGCRAEGPAAPGRTIPRRVVALAPNLTEIVFALGAGSMLVGVSEYSDFPEAARHIRRVGGLEVDPEKVAALRPDLVLAMAEGSARGAVRALEAAGLPVTVVPSGSLDAVLEGIRLVGERLGRREAAIRLADELARRREAVRRRMAGRRRPRALLLVWPDPPQAAGGGTFLNDVLTEAGAGNLVGDRNGWPILSAEYVATAPVELLVLPDSGQTRPAFERALSRGPLSRGPVAQAKLVRLDEASLTRPGPRVFGMLERLAEAIR
ncbi:MAG TPA: helical backbone metal receptor [Thermoanaerobaculia bacterium]